METFLMKEVDNLMQVLQAIKNGQAVECRRLEEEEWQPFDFSDDEINTEDFKYRVKPGGYGEYMGDEVAPGELQENLIYYMTSKSSSKEKWTGFFCVKNNTYYEDKKINVHFSYDKFDKNALLKVCDPFITYWHSEETSCFANIICRGLTIDDPDAFVYRLAAIEHVKMLKKVLHDIGYKFENGKMQKI